MKQIKDNFSIELEFFFMISNKKMLCKEALGNAFRRLHFQTSFSRLKLKANCNILFMQKIFGINLLFLIAGGDSFAGTTRRRGVSLYIKDKIYCNS
jgi:hypothetical protein